MWVAEVMAQQTRIQTVAGYYARFIDRFPSVSALAEAPLDDVLKVWEGLGYYARARNLHAAARQVIDEHGGRVPSTVEGLRSLAGVGPYTAGAIASLAFGVAEPAVDGNARRVLARLFDLEEPTRSRVDQTARAMLAAWPDRPAAINQALMDLGEAICTPLNPNCGACPVRSACRALAADMVGDRPPPSKRTPIPSRSAASAMLWRNGRILLTRRPLDGLLGGLWDFPGVGPTPDRTGPAVLREAIAHTLGLRIDVGGRLGTIDHTFSHFRLRLTVYEAIWEAGEPPPDAEVRWCPPEHLGAFAFPGYLQSFLNPSREPPVRPRQARAGARA